MPPQAHNSAQYRRAAILNGDKPADLPVELPAPQLSFQSGRRAKRTLFELPC
jgi:hypothetical protein